MYAMKANFFPAQGEHENYIGKADITVGNAIRINNISVFEQEGKRGLSFAEFGPADNKRSYVIPASKEAYAAMLDVVSQAVDSEKHFAFTRGNYNVRLEVSGARVNEPYVDGRFSVAVGALCTLNGISTRVVDYEKDGKASKFVSVDLPTVTGEDGKAKRYTDREGKEHVNHQFEGLVDTWTDKEGTEQKRDYGLLLRNLVLGKRKELAEPSLDDKIAEGQAQAKATDKESQPPVKEDDERLPR